MFQNYGEFQQAIHDYLSDIINGYGGFPSYYEEFDQDTLKVIEACANEGYISQIEIWHDANGSIHVGYLGNVYVTLKGYQFVNEFEDNTPTLIAKRAERRAKLSTLISVAAILVSAFALLVEFASNYEKISEFIQLLKSICG